jgi:hypothetical protein
MYIQSYQIHNVLNEYRKRLSQAPERNTNRGGKAKASLNDKVQLSEAGHRQAIIDQVSARIVERITTYGPQNQFEESLSTYMPRSDEKSAASQGINGLGFTYTTIDEDNRKLTQTFTMDSTGSSMTPMEKADTERALPDETSGASEI